MGSFDNDVYALLPELFLLGAALALLLFGVVYSTAPDYGSPSLVQTTQWFALLSLGLTAVLLANQPVTTMLCLSQSVQLDPFVTFCKTLILAGSLGAGAIAFQYLDGAGRHSFEASVLALLATLSLLCLVSAADLLPMYLALEMQSLCFYVLAASQRDSEFSTEAGLKYFLLGAFSSGLFLLGCALLYGLTGCTSFEALALLCAGGYGGDGGLVPLALGLLGVGFCFKLGAAPFHFWAPDVYEGAPTHVTAFFAIVPKAALLGLFAKLFLGSFLELMPLWQPALLGVGALSLLVGAVGAFAQRKLKRLLVYSGIGHLGFMLLGLGCGTPEGLQAVLVYLALYLVMSLQVFACVLALQERTSGQRVRYIEDVRGLAQAHPALAAALSLNFFSMAGLPPLVGFCAKFAVFFAALGANLALAVGVAVASSVVSCFYALRFLKWMYFEGQAGAGVAWAPMDLPKAWVIAVTSSALLLGFVFPTPLFLWAEKAAAALL